MHNKDFFLLLKKKPPGGWEPGIQAGGLPQTTLPSVHEQAAGQHEGPCRGRGRGQGTGPRSPASGGHRTRRLKPPSLSRAEGGTATVRPESGACTATSVTGLIQGLRPPAAWHAPGDPGPLASPQEVPRGARTAGAAWPSEGRPEKGPGRRARGGRAGRGAEARGGTRAETGRGRGTPCGGGAEARGGAQSGGSWKASLEQSAGDGPSRRRPAGREPARGGKCGRAAPLGASVGGREALFCFVSNHLGTGASVK